MCNPHIIYGSLGPRETVLQRLFCRFYILYWFAERTYTQTNHAMSATSIHAMLAMQAKNYKIYEPLAEDLLMKRFQN